MRKVAVVVQDGVEAFGLGAMCEVWNEPYHPEDDNPVFDFVVVTPRPGRIHGSGGFDLVVDHGLDAAADADLICVAPRRRHDEADEGVLELLRAADRDQRRIFAHCSAAFTVGAAGLLDGRRCTTHWRYVDRLRAAYPEATVDGDVLYVQDGNLTTGAGSAAGLDAALHLMRAEFGAKVAATAARRMVVPPHRDGGQAQFIARQVPECESEVLRPLLDWVVANLADDHSVESLARRAHMSSRTFARRFRDEMGTTPHNWLIQQRVAAAEELLERTERPVEWVAAEVGFGNAAALRHHFTRTRGISPQQYRRSFCPAVS
jgi:transcriptional regulator GlxA family with amidase domain